MMKKLIFIFLLILPLVGLGQKDNNLYPNPYNIPTINITTNPGSTGWSVTGSSCAGCASFFYKILRSDQTYQFQDGYYYYYYYFIFYSNSYYSNGSKANTYLTNAQFYSDGVFVIKQNYILLEQGKEKFVAWIRNQNGISSVTFHIDNITVY